jgi:hypothetical protein
MIRRGLLFHYDTLVLLEGGLDLYTKYVERERERDGAERENGHANWQGPAWVTVKGGKPGVLSYRVFGWGESNRHTYLG